MTGLLRHRLPPLLPIALIAALLFAQLLASCAPALPPADPERAAQLRSQGFQAGLKYKFAEAAAHYAEASRYDPQNSRNYFDQAEYREADAEYAAAAAAYTTGLDRLERSHPDRERLRYRLGLVQAGWLKAPDAAEDQLARLDDPLLKADLAGVIAMARGELRRALQQFQAALQLNPEREAKGRIHFHIARTYDRLDDEGRSRDALLIAVQNAASRALKEDIRRFFEGLISGSKPKP